MATAATARRRVSYTVPAPSATPPRFQLPDIDHPRFGTTGPLVVQHPDHPDQTENREATSTSSFFPRHRLGLSSFALDTTTLLAGHSTPEGILYSGSRDGQIIAWELGLPMRKRHRIMTSPASRWEHIMRWEDDSEEEEETAPSDGDILEDVKGSQRRPRTGSTSASSPTNGHEEPWEYERRWELDGHPKAKTSFRQRVQVHSDWINDVMLSNYNQTLISASNDGTVKAWSPHSPTFSVPHTVGTHTDYVRCLTQSSVRGWIASGSLDRSIKLWDLSRSTSSNARSLPESLSTLAPHDPSVSKASVYALSTDSSGTIIASGSPERVVRLWDPRTGKRTGKLVGHTDNIRAILISDDARYLLTGSADASVKLWSLAYAHRCLHTFTHHTESVWSLFSAHPALQTFYSGDRAGNVCKTDLVGCGDVSEGECAVICREQDGVSALHVLDDAILWTATSESSLRRWRCPPPNLLSVALVSPISSPLAEQPLQPPSRSGTQPGVPWASLVRLRSPDDPFAPVGLGGGAALSRDAEVSTLYSAASVHSVPHLPNRSHSGNLGSPVRVNGGVDIEPRMAYEARDVAPDAVPLRMFPDDVVYGVPGLVRAALLNDRLHALTVDTGGSVALWDILRGTCLGYYTANEVSGGQGKLGPREALEVVRERVEGEAVMTSWAALDTRIGDLTVHLLERQCFDGEVFADEVGFKGTKKYAEDYRREYLDVNIGKWILRNLFESFIAEQLRISGASGTEHSQLSPKPSSGISRSMAPKNLALHSTTSNMWEISADDATPIAAFALPQTPAIVPNDLPITRPAMAPSVPPIPLTKPVGAPLSPIIQSPVPGVSTKATPRGGPTTAPATKTRDGDYFSARLAPSGSSNAEPATPSDDFSGWGGPGSKNADGASAVSQTPVTPGGIMGRFKNFGGKTGTKKIFGTDSSIAGAASQISGEEIAKDQAAEEQNSPIIALRARGLTPPSLGEAPGLSLAPSTVITISEERAGATAGQWTTIYRGSIGTTGSDAPLLEEAMPTWLFEYLLGNRLPSSLNAAAKLSFVLLPLPSSAGSPAEPEDCEDKLPGVLDSSQSKLTASRFLRVRKLAAHVQDKLDKLSSQEEPDSSPVADQSSRHRSRPEDTYEILCNGVVLPMDMTLAVVRQYVWKQSNELTMYYRRRRRTHGARSSTSSSRKSIRSFQ